VIEGDRLVRSGQWTGWTPTQLLGTAVAGRTLGIIGMGRIGQAVARGRISYEGVLLLTSARRQSIGRRGMGVPPPAGTARGIGHRHHSRALTQETRHLIGAQELAKMRRTAILINTARGPIVDESALVAALMNGAISGAGLDVFEEEPRLHPRLATMPQVVLLPHLGSATMEARVEMGMTCVKNIEAVLSGQPAPNRVS
jgi:glyoxylate reductase